MLFEIAGGNSADGMAAAEHLLSALLYSSGDWYRNNPTVELVFKKPGGGMILGRKSYEVVNRQGWLLVRKSSTFVPDWVRDPLFRTKSPREALQAAAKDAQGPLVKVGVECKDNSGDGGTCDDATFWDTRWDHRGGQNKNNANANKNKKKTAAQSLANAAARRL
jgi:hypothetical protein